MLIFHRGRYRGHLFMEMSLVSQRPGFPRYCEGARMPFTGCRDHRSSGCGDEEPRQPDKNSRLVVESLVLGRLSAEAGQIRGGDKALRTGGETRVQRLLRAGEPCKCLDTTGQSTGGY